jgi:hypothetical protein
MYPGPYAPAPMPPASARAARPRVRPSAWWYAAAAGVAAAGLVAGGVVIGRTAIGYGDRIDGFDRVEVPGTMEVELRGTGGYSIYHEYEGAFDEDQAFGEDLDPRDLLLVPRPTVTVTGPSGDEVPLEGYETKVSYDADTHEGIGLYTFRVDDPGTYEVVASGDTAPTGSVIAVGRGVSTGVITGVITGLLVGFVGVVAGVVIAIVLMVRRGRNRRAQASPPPSPYASFGPPAAWPAGYGMQPPPVPPADAPLQPSAPLPDALPPSAPSSVEPAPPGPPPPRPPPPPPPSATAPPPDSAGRGTGPALAAQSRPVSPPPAFRDPPSLRARDWSRDDVPLPWSPDRP